MARASGPLLTEKNSTTSLDPRKGKKDTAQVRSASFLVSTSLILLSSLTFGTGCFTTPKSECSFACGANSECPSGYYCAADSWCKSEGTAEDFDCGAVLVDAAPADAPELADAAPDAGTDATIALCGDNTVTSPETCDDGNQVDDGNGCGAACQRNDSCGNSATEALFETCDDGNTDACGTCSAACDAVQGGGDCAGGVGCTVNGDCASNSCSGTCAAV